MSYPAGFPALLESFFTKRLIAQGRVSPHTIASYRDTFHVLLQFTHRQLGKTPSQITLEDLNAPLIGAFLDDLERGRNNSVRSRNLRITVIRSFFRYAAMEAPQHSGLIQRVLAIPSKRQERRLVGFLTRPEVDALLAAPNRNTWLGRRDDGLLLMAIQTGLRLSEMTALHQEDVVLGKGAHVRCQGKGRKERCTPLTKSTVSVLTEWLREQGRLGTLILFRPLAAVGSAPTPSSTWSQSTKRWPAKLVRPSAPSASHPTCLDTPPRWNCSRPGWTALSSPFGSDTNLSKLRRFIWMPTSL